MVGKETSGGMGIQTTILTTNCSSNQPPGQTDLVKKQQQFFLGTHAKKTLKIFTAHLLQKWLTCLKKH